jgi:hypothetical protein
MIGPIQVLLARRPRGRALDVAPSADETVVASPLPALTGEGTLGGHVIRIPIVPDPGKKWSTHAD